MFQTMPRVPAFVSKGSIFSRSRSWK